MALCCGLLRLQSSRLQIELEKSRKGWAASRWSPLCSPEDRTALLSYLGICGVPVAAAGGACDLRKGQPACSPFQAPGVSVARRVVINRLWNLARLAPNNVSNCREIRLLHTCSETGPRAQLAGAVPGVPSAPLVSPSASSADFAGPAGGLGSDPFLLLILKSYFIGFLSF